ncbi:class I tRNA ligase family protein [Shigella flexneri]
MPDTLDVWFDLDLPDFLSLTSSEFAGHAADMYLEGSDQHRGWFMLP